MSLNTNKSFLGSVRSVHIERADFYWESSQLKQELPSPKETIIFDKEGKMIENITYRDRVLTYRCINSFDVHGNLAESIFYSAKNYLKKGSVAKNSSRRTKG